MKLRSSGFLGLSVSDRTIACAEVSVAGGRRVARRLATFHVPQGASLDKPEALGAALAAFLREKGFNASRAVVGLPAKWMIAIEREIPPAGDEEARAMLRLQAERLAVSESGEVVFDYAAGSGAAAANPAVANKYLLVGVLRQRIDQLDRLLEAARLTGVAITSSALALASEVAAADDRDVPMLVLGRQGAEMVWRHAGAPRMLRHVSVIAVNGHGPVAVAPIGSELGRAVSLTRANGSPAVRDVILWDGIGLSSDQVTELSTRSGLNVRSSDTLAALGVEAAPNALADNDPRPATPGATDTDVFAPALSLALAAADRARLPVDFKHSRLTPPKRRRVGKGTTWAAIAGTLVVLGLVLLYAYVEGQQRELDRLNASLKGNQDAVKAAKAQVDRYNYARGFFDARPPMLDAFREIALQFRDEDRMWITSVVAKDDRKITLQGKADTDATVRRFLDRLKADPKFAGATLNRASISEGTRERSTEISFSITLNYVATE